MMDNIITILEPTKLCMVLVYVLCIEFVPKIILSLKSESANQKAIKIQLKHLEEVAKENNTTDSFVEHSKTLRSINYMKSQLKGETKSGIINQLIKLLAFALRYIPIPFLMYFFYGIPLISLPVTWCRGLKFFLSKPGCEIGFIGISFWFMSCKYVIGLYK